MRGCSACSRKLRPPLKAASQEEGGRAEGNSSDTQSASQDTSATFWPDTLRYRKTFFCTSHRHCSPTHSASIDWQLRPNSSHTPTKSTLCSMPNSSKHMTVAGPLYSIQSSSRTRPFESCGHKRGSPEARKLHCCRLRRSCSSASLRRCSARARSSSSILLLSAFSFFPSSFNLRSSSSAFCFSASIFILLLCNSFCTPSSLRICAWELDSRYLSSSKPC
mmetsp:Transcript_126639/g.300880  ORF Transcript_126639/g.300880 Transcript_126639/m.300880 type:complete len:220 (-) Transcript_126639:277-936(-)